MKAMKRRPFPTFGLSVPQTYNCFLIIQSGILNKTNHIFTMPYFQLPARVLDQPTPNRLAALLCVFFGTGGLKRSLALGAAVALFTASRAANGLPGVL